MMTNFLINPSRATYVCDINVYLTKFYILYLIMIDINLHHIGTGDFRFTSAMGLAVTSHHIHIPKCTNLLTVYMAQSLCCTFTQNTKDCLKPVTDRQKVHVGGLQVESQFVNSNRLNRWYG
jgi:hypothetical protein